MKFVKLCLFIIFVVNFRVALSQNSNENFEPKLTGKLFIYDLRIMGSQFLFENWVKGDIRLYNGMILKNKLLNYNGYINKFVWINDLNLSIILDDNYISQVNLNVDSLNVLLFSKIFYLKDSLEIFAQRISDDKIKLYVYRQIKKDKEVEISKDRDCYRKILLKCNPAYIFIFPNQKQITISKLSNRLIIKAFPPSDQHAVKDVLVKNNLKIKSEKDLILFNALLSKVFSP